MRQKQNSLPPDSLSAAIIATSLTKSFGVRKALDDVSFTLPRFGFLSVFGPNGAGKSTLLRILATLARPSQGSAHVLGHDIQEQTESLRRYIGVISHRSMLYPDLTAAENLMLYAKLYGVVDPAQRVKELLDLVELTGRRHDTVKSFSRGMTQRIAIARALVNDPELLFLDEPYSGLDPRAVEIFDQLIERVRPGKSFFMVSHDLTRGFDSATHVMVLSQGRLVFYEEKPAIDRDLFSSLYRELVGVALA
ncbi:MAG: ABC transporter ATP-binding protein [Coriobacteriales bacterium]|jgi:heme exporter protein A|nr:ABC transporter ATP-binding protein [Coriobacteriales bacterium]